MLRHSSYGVYRTHTTRRYLYCRLWTYNYSELVCRYYVKFYDIMLMCDNENVRLGPILSTVGTGHGPLGRNRVHIYHTVGVDV